MITDLGFADVFVAAIVALSLIVWARQKQRRMDRDRERDERWRVSLYGRDC